MVLNVVPSERSHGKGLARTEAPAREGEGAWPRARVL